MAQYGQARLWPSAAYLLCLLGCMEGSKLDHAEREQGHLEAALRLADDSEIEAVDYTLSGDNGYARSGRVAVGSSTVLRFRIGGIPISSSPYHLLLTSVTRHGAACGGSADFSVSQGTTRVSVLVECMTEDTEGDLIVDGELRSCPLVSALELIPAQVSLGGSVSLQARLSHGNAPVRWSGPGGSFSTPGAYATRYTCTEVGTHLLVVSVAQPGCSDSASAEVSCERQSTSSTPEVLGLDARPPNPSCVAWLAGTPAPLRLSDTGCFEASRPSEPVAAMLPFEVNAALWSDGATKRRWLALPDGETIALAEDGDFEFPVGSVLAKEFRVAGRLVETRLLVFQPAGTDASGLTIASRWAGYAYRWNAAQTDADLVADGTDNRVDLDGMGPGTDSWHIPTQSECLTCHTAVAGFTLGPEVAQLNRDLTYPSTGRRANQLSTLAQIGVFEKALPSAPSQLPRLADYANTSDPAFTLDDRARAYLHANCSMCHRKPSAGGTASPAPEDFRASLPLRDMHACNESPRTAAAIGLRMNLSRAKILAPGAPMDSVMYRRMTSRPNLQMPPLGTQKVDPLGSQLIESWITSIGQCPP